MRLTLILIFVCVLNVHAEIVAQTAKVDLDVKNVELKSVLTELTRQTDLKFFFNHQELDVETRVTVRAVKADINDVLRQILGRNYEFEEFEGMVIIKPASEPQARSAVPFTGIVTGTDGKPVIGATVTIKGTQIGVMTDAAGHFELNIPASAAPSAVIIVSFVGMKTQEIPYRGQQNMSIVLESGVDIDEVVITGMYEANKNSVPGSHKTIMKEDMKMVSNTNLIQAISMLTPGLKISEDNSLGANPNALPEIILRGTSSLSSQEDLSPNQPLLILDGIQITLRDLYDLDVNEIERIDILKDASATALYGERAANGVIVIIRERVKQDRLRLSYNFDSSIEVPDIRSYDYLNAAEKLEFEEMVGLYDFEDRYSLEEYNRKKLLISEGVDTDWMSKPLRTGMTISNSIGISGRGSNMTYRMNANMRNMKGVMKDDYRNTYGLSLFLSYNIDRKLTVSFQSSYSLTKSKDSPYGSFSDYVRANPYDLPYDSDGRPFPTLSWHNPDTNQAGNKQVLNPLYEAVAGNYSKGETSSFVNSLNLRWDVIKDLYVTASGSITKIGTEDEKFLSPTSVEFETETDLTKKGSMDKKYAGGVSYEGNVVVNYNWRASTDFLTTFHVGADIARSDITTNAYKMTGFVKSNLNAPGFSAIYPEDEKPTTDQELTTRMGVFGNINFIALNRYFIDASIRRSGSSQFGANNRYAPFWSVGAGWNIHNEKFINNDIFNLLRLRYSYGVTGNVSFSPYQAITTYEYGTRLYYLHGMGALPKQMGNPDLTWQSTRMHNLGLNLDLWQNRLSITVDYYVKTTDDLLIDLTVPPSVGESSVKRNLGKTQNKGFEADIAAVLFSNADWRVNLRLNAAHNRNKIQKISNALKAQNAEANKSDTSAPRMQYEEGQSLTAIYAVRSAGINPATGQEVFIKRNGNYTTEYDVNDKVVLGDLEPKVEGAVFPSVYYKGWSLQISMAYRFGGQIYNSTRASNVENVDPKYNVDRRAYELRWKHVNDVVEYLDIADLNARSTYRHTSRFIEDDNTVEVKSIQLGYEFDAPWMKKVGLKRLRISAGVTNPFRISSVNYERGIVYPFSRGFSFTISPTF